MQVGKQTVAGTKDDQLKKDMPPTFKIVEESTDTLVEASKGLAADAESKPHKKMLLDGARGQLVRKGEDRKREGGRREERREREKERVYRCM